MNPSYYQIQITRLNEEISLATQDMVQFLYMVDFYEYKEMGLLDVVNQLYESKQDQLQYLHRTLDDFVFLMEDTDSYFISSILD